jgi:hypothetical protein
MALEVLSVLGGGGKLPSLAVAERSNTGTAKNTGGKKECKRESLDIDGRRAQLREEGNEMKQGAAKPNDRGSAWRRRRPVTGLGDASPKRTRVSQSHAAARFASSASPVPASPRIA